MAPPYKPVGTCIYCGATSYRRDGTPLRREHIVPAAIDGNWELPQASCRHCEEITGRFEQRAFRGALRAIRVDMGLGRANEPVTHLPLFDVDGIPGNKIDIEISSYPVVLMLMCFSAPSIIHGASKASDALSEGMCLYYKAERGTLPFGGRNFASSSLDGLSLSRTLAKTAHAYACAELGLGNFTPYLTEYILTDLRSDDDIYNKQYIGCAPLARKRSRALHQIGLQEINYRDKRLIAVDLRLFCRFGMPCYRVIAGEVEASFRGNVRLADGGLFAHFERELPAGR